MSINRIILCLLLVLSFFSSGCVGMFLVATWHPTQMFARHSNPIDGWKSIGSVGCKNEEMSAEISPIPGYEAVSEDVQKFVNKLPVDHSSYGTRRWCYWIYSMQFYEDGTGQHAVGFTIPHDGTDWGYVLIYDKNNKRLKAVRYVQGHYMS